MLFIVRPTARPAKTCTIPMTMSVGMAGDSIRGISMHRPLRMYDRVGLVTWEALDVLEYEDYLPESCQSGFR